MSMLNDAISKANYVSFILSRKLKSKIRAGLFSGSKGLRSDSDDGFYLEAVSKSLRAPRYFNNFKRRPAYRYILEHVSKEQGSEYLKILESRGDDVLDVGLTSVLLSDNLGNPMKYFYPKYNFKLSPTTLRYLKVASDLKILFGDELGKVAEIGCGYGGQSLVNDCVLNVSSAKLFDLPLVNKLIERYLNSHLLNGSFSTTTINNEDPQEYDLVISNYAFSELPKKLQTKYIHKVLSKSKRGYLTMNSGIGGVHSVGKLTLDELKQLLPEFTILQEEPSTSSNNYIIVWGHFTNSLDKAFKEFQS
jgi:hypothetical protein